MTDMVQVRRLPITPQLRQRILERDKFSCRYCGSKKPPFHLDHVYPVVKGGETSEDNLVTSCSNCNQKKHDKVGIYPKPIGYFEVKPNQLHISISNVFFLSIGVGLIASGNSVFSSGGWEVSKWFFLFGFIFCSISLVKLALGK